MFLYSLWQSLSLPTRAQIAQVFNISKRNPIHVDSNRIVNDGYLIKEVEEALNIDALQKYLETTSTDMEAIWDMLVAKIEGREYKVNLETEAKVALGTTIKIAEEVSKKIVKKRGRPAKK